ncbi:MAG: thioredoxin domain-containing protein [Ignavibacteria bacterium]|nr:thioredoxin domain-containing protein [Ignavibacteria bacterium]
MTQEQNSWLRSLRPKPHLDDKILTSWNGLMISALAKMYQVTRNNLFLESAFNTVDFISDKLYDKINKTLLHRYRDGETRFEGTIEDYAYFIAGLIDLYEACFDTKYLELAIELNTLTIDKFYDNESAGFFDVTKEGVI